MKKEYIFTLLLIIVVGLFLFLYPKTIETPATEPAPTDNTPEVSDVLPMADEADMEDASAPTEEMVVVQKHSGDLADVSGGQSSGKATATYNEKQYVLNAVFTDLPDPEGTDFYEGWIVRRGSDLSVISTGKATKEAAGTYSNVYTSQDNMLDHNFYVLTLEPDDGDPAPAAHILEGVLSEEKE